MARRATPSALWTGGLLVALWGAAPHAPSPDPASTAPRAHAQPPSEACADRPRLQAGARIALGALRAEHGAALRGCGDVLRCGEAPPTADRTRCVTELAPEPWGYRVRVVPRAVSGAPAELRLNVDVAAGTTHQVVASGNRWAVGRGVAIVGLSGHRIHSHGGEPAHISSARFRAWNDSAAPMSLALAGGAFVHNARERPLVNATLDSASLPPGESEVEVRFERHEAYQSWNDHFSVLARLRAGGVALTPSAEWLVTRVTPLRR
jgi:hypothetical protein